MRFLSTLLVLVATAITSISASPIAAPEPAPAPVAAPQSSQDDTWQNRLLNKHNYYRQRHYANQLYWSNDLQSSAQRHADRCTFGVESGRNGYGQNYYQFYGTPLGQGLWNAVDSWYKGNQYYDWRRAEFNWQAGGFTQVVWKSTSQLGCAYKSCPKDGRTWWVIVCNYKDQGNIDGSYRQNVYQSR